MSTYIKILGKFGHGLVFLLLLFLCEIHAACKTRQNGLLKLNRNIGEYIVH